MGETKTLKEVKDKTLTMLTKEEVAVEEGVEQLELMETVKVVVPTMQVQLLRMIKRIFEKNLI